MRVLDIGKRSVKRSRPYTPSQTFLEHTLAIAEAYTEIVVAVRNTPNLELISMEVEGEAARTHVRPASYLFPSKTTKIWPDLFVCLEGVNGNGGRYRDHWYIEVDLGTERSKAITDKCLRYIEYYKTGKPREEHGIIPAVLFVVPDEKRKEAIAGVIGKLEDKRYQRCFAVVTQGEYLAKIVG